MDYSTEKILEMWEKQKNDNLRAFYIIMAVIVATGLILACLAGCAEASDIVKEPISNCENVEALPAGLKKAYEGLKASGHDVKINCYSKDQGLTDKEKEAIKRLREELGR